MNMEYLRELIFIGIGISILLILVCMTLVVIVKSLQVVGILS